MLGASAESSGMTPTTHTHPSPPPIRWVWIEACTLVRLSDNIAEMVAIPEEFGLGGGGGAAPLGGGVQIRSLPFVV